MDDVGELQCVFLVDRRPEGPHLRSMDKTDRSPSVQYVRSAEDLEHIIFTDGVAAVEAPADLLRQIRFKNAKRKGGPRLDAVVRSIRDRGYVPVDPIIARIGQKGKWVVVDGGHRLTALKLLLKSFWSRLFGRKFGNVYFLLFETERSRAKMGG